MSNFAPNLSTGPCLYCNDMAKEGPEEMLRCELCRQTAHITCLKSGIPEGRLLGDNFFSFTCSACQQSDLDSSVRAKLNTPQLLLLVLYNLHMTAPNGGRQGFYHWKIHIYNFINQHWKEIFGPERYKKKKKTLQASLSGQLSHYGQYFVSGYETLQDGGWYKLSMILPPAQLIQQYTAEKAKGAASKNVVKEERMEVSCIKEEVVEAVPFAPGDISFENNSHDESSQGSWFMEKDVLKPRSQPPLSLFDSEEEVDEGSVVKIECESETVKEEIDFEFVDIDEVDEPVDDDKTENQPCATKSSLFTVNTTTNDSGGASISSSLATGDQVVSVDSAGKPLSNVRLRTQTKNVILNIHRYFLSLSNYTLLSDVDKQTAAAAQVSLRAIQRLRTEHRKSKNGIIKSSARKKRPSYVIGSLDDFDRECMRREILAFYERGELPTLAGLFERVKEPPVNYSGGKSSLHSLLRLLGFRFKRMVGGRAVLLEHYDIVVARNKYLREIRRNRNSSDPRPVIYLDETWVPKEEEVAEGSSGSKAKTGKNSGFIIIHAGSYEGFIPKALLMFLSKSGTKGVCFDSVTPERFQTWFEKQLLPNIPSKSLIIMDNAPYHSKVVSKVPSRSFKKEQIIEWLTLNNIPHDPNFTKPELLHIARHHKEKQPYLIDQIAASLGHQVLRVPLHHCVFNPIEFIWSRVKTHIKKQISDGNQKRKSVQDMVFEAVLTVTPEDWKKCIEHTTKIEEDYCHKDAALEKLFENSTIVLSHSDESSDESSSDDDI